MSDPHPHGPALDGVAGPGDVIRYDRDGDGIVTLTLDEPGSRTNRMNETFRRALAGALDRLDADRALDPGSVRGLLVTSAKSTFVAGGDLRWLSSIDPEAAPTFFAELEALTAQLRRLETLGLPVVAAINGSALGGGLELALACHHRIVVDDPALEIGLPEVTLGLMPGAGGVTRTVRLLGVQRALAEVLLEGRRMTPATARAVGLVDGLVTSRAELLPAARRWLASVAGDATARTQPWDRAGYRMPGGAPGSTALAAVLPVLPAMLRQRLGGASQPAPRAILAAAVEGAQVDSVTATRIANRYLTSLVLDPTSRNMIQAFFFDMQQIRTGGPAPRDRGAATARSFGVVGPGSLGSGLSAAATAAGLDVVPADPDRLDALAGCDAVLIDTGDGNGSGTDTGGGGSSGGGAGRGDPPAELVRRLEGVVGAESLLLVSLPSGAGASLAPLVALASRPERLFGMHVLEPSRPLRLVEVVPGPAVSPAALARALRLLRQLSLLPLVVPDVPGFYTGRLRARMLAEAALLRQEGVPAVTVARAATTAGFATSPLASLGGSTPAHPRSGGGPRSGGAAAARPGHEVSLREVQERYLVALALETADCLREGIVDSTAAANVGSILGAGFPAHTGGTAQFMTGYAGGLEAFVSRARELANEHGPRFEPPGWLVARAAAGQLQPVPTS